MKNLQRKLMKGAVGLGLGLIAIGAVDAQQPPQQKPELGAMILLEDGRRQRGYIQDTSKEGLLFALVERGPGNGYYWDTQVKAVNFDISNDIMRDARAVYGQGNLDEAVTRFGQIADGYANMAWVPNGFVAEARYYQIEALRRLNRFAEIAPLLETPSGQAIDSRLGEFYKPQHELNKVWALYGKEDWAGVKAAIESRQKPPVGNQVMLPAPVFQNMSAREMVQLAFMRAKVFEAAGEEGKALDDYYRAFTLTYGNNPELALPAMEAAMAIHKKNPRLDDKKNKTPLRQMQSMAFLFKNAFASGEIPSDFAEFAVRPELPKPPEPKKEEDDLPPAAEPKKMEPEGDDKPAPAAGDDKGKGKGKGKSKSKAEPPAADGDKGKGKGKSKAAPPAADGKAKPAPAPAPEPKPAE